eukprot:m.1577229 g.1577229  ORF g.1577229 m.1577229 type:complete len:457 (-) comp25309_c0_seq14:2069-3439(-)
MYLHIVQQIFRAWHPRTFRQMCLPTVLPSAIPTESPTGAPSDAPSSAPTALPTDSPSDVPTDIPTDTPTQSPTVALCLQCSAGAGPCIDESTGSCSAFLVGTQSCPPAMVRCSTSEAPTTLPTLVPTGVPTGLVADCSGIPDSQSCIDVTISLCALAPDIFVVNCPASCGACTTTSTTTSTATTSTVSSQTTTTTETTTTTTSSTGTTQTFTSTTGTSTTTSTTITSSTGTSTSTVTSSTVSSTSSTSVSSTTTRHTDCFGVQDPDACALLDLSNCTRSFVLASCPAMCFACTTAPTASPTSAPTDAPSPRSTASTCSGIPDGPECVGVTESLCIAVPELFLVFCPAACGSCTSTSINRAVLWTLGNANAASCATRVLHFASSALPNPRQHQPALRRRHRPHHRQRQLRQQHSRRVQQHQCPPALFQRPPRPVVPAHQHTHPRRPQPQHGPAQRQR